MRCSSSLRRAGECDLAQYQYLVVYDPAGGFVTGGGWIGSAQGYCHLDAVCGAAEGKASFGFVSKYKKGATVPEGNTQFQFQAGNLNFHSASYQWLVVNRTGTNAQFKGYGTINGAGDYGFMIWAGDGSPDTFRIKIWVADDETNVVYDNGVANPLAVAHCSSLVADRTCFRDHQPASWAWARLWFRAEISKQNWPVTSSNSPLVWG
jgi:hypothetical protein